MKISKNHISSLLKITKHFLGLDESVLSKCKFCAMFYLEEFHDKNNSLSVKTLQYNLPTSKVQAHYTENKVLSIYYLVYTYRTSLGTLTSLHTRFPFVCLFFFSFFFAPLLLLFRKRNLIISDLSFTGAVFFCFRYSNAIASVRM